MGFGCWGLPPARGINLFALQCAVWVGVIGTCALAGPAKGALAWATQNPRRGAGRPADRGPAGRGLGEDHGLSPDPTGDPLLSFANTEAPDYLVNFYV